MRFSVECAFPHLRKRGATSRKSALWIGISRKSALWGLTLTEKRILHPPSHGKPHSAPAMRSRRDRRAHSGWATSRRNALCVWASPKGALCMRAVVAPRAHFRRSAYTAASPRLPATAQQCTQVPRNSAERPFSPICVHSCVAA